MCRLVVLESALGLESGLKSIFVGLGLGLGFEQKGFGLGLETAGLGLGLGKIRNQVQFQFSLCTFAVFCLRGVTFCVTTEPDCQTNSCQD